MAGVGTIKTWEPSSYHADRRLPPERSGPGAPVRFRLEDRRTAYVLCPDDVRREYGQLRLYEMLAEWLWPPRRGTIRLRAGREYGAARLQSPFSAPAGVRLLPLTYPDAPGRLADLEADLAELREELVEARITAARAEAEKSAIAVVVAELKAQLEHGRAEQQALRLELEKSRRP